jgi:hypothetical protein
MPKVKKVMQTIFNKAPNKIINPNKCVAIGVCKVKFYEVMLMIFFYTHHHS